jgi:hypothetical protein
MVAVSCLPCSYAKAWSPSDLVATLTAWQKAGSTVGVETWQDSSGNDNDLSQTSSGDQPSTTTLNGLTVLDFDDSNNEHMDYGDLDAMDVGTGDFYTFIVFNPDKTNSNMALLAKHSGADDYLLRIVSTRKIQQYIGSASSGVVTGSTTLSASTTYIAAGYRKSSVSYARVDGDAQGNAINANSLSNARDFHVAGQASAGTAANFDGQIAEIVMGGGTISDGEIFAIEGYLADRFGTVASLPATHKYKKGKPWGLGKVT